MTTGPGLQCSCTDCRTGTLSLEPGVPTEFYMVHDDLWAEAGMDRGYLCIGCLETRLGRRLHRGDFTAAEVNDLSCHCPGRPWWWRSNRLRDRLTTPSPHDGTQLPLWGPPAGQTLTSPAIQPLFPGQTVRWCSELLRGWYEGRAADGMPYAPAPRSAASPKSSPAPAASAAYASTTTGSAPDPGT